MAQSGGLNNVSLETLSEIASYLGPGDTLNLMRASRGFAIGLKPALYRNDGKRDNHAIAWTAEHGGMAVASKALDAGADPSSVHHRPSAEIPAPAMVTPLYMAIATRHFDVARLLIERRADVNQQSNGLDNGTVTTSGSPVFFVVDLMTSFGRGPRVPDETNAVRMAAVGILELLLARGASAAAAQLVVPRGRLRGALPDLMISPLWVAMSSRAPASVVHLLLRHGARPRVGVWRAANPAQSALWATGTPRGWLDWQGGRWRVRPGGHALYAAKARLLHWYEHPGGEPDRFESVSDGPATRTRSKKKSVVACHICGNHGSGPWCPMVNEKHLR